MTSYTLDQAITSTVATRQDTGYTLVLKTLAGKNLYFSLHETSVNSRLRQPEIPTYQVGPMRCIKLYTTRTHPALSSPYGEIKWESAVDMLLKAPTLDGIKVVNEADNWVAYSKSELQTAVAV